MDPNTTATTAAVVGGSMLREVEETSLDEVLSTLRQNLISLTTPATAINSTATQRGITTTGTTTLQPKRTSIAQLDGLIERHFRDTRSTQVSIAGRALPLIYALVSRLVTERGNVDDIRNAADTAERTNSVRSRGKTVLVVDLEARFDATRLRCPEADLRHVYVFRPPRCISGADEVRLVVADAQRWMLYGRHESRGREWWGTVLVGGPGGDVSAGWKGWMRVDLDEEEIGPGLGGGLISAEEALARRQTMQKAADGAGWVVSSDWGGFRFREGDLTVRQGPGDE